MKRFELPIQEIDGTTLNPVQRKYLSGFFAGVQARGLSFGDLQPQPAAAQDEADLTFEERVKRERHPLDAWQDLAAASSLQTDPSKEDMFRFKWHGLFYLTPVHGAYMARLRIPGGWLRSFQFRELAAIAEELSSGYVQITTRSNLQIRLIPAANAPELLRRIEAVGLHTRGAGADNVRNLTANPTAGVDPHELWDVRPLVQSLGQALLNDRRFSDLPRKFNIAYDGGGRIGVVEDTNDIGARAVLYKGKPGFRLSLGGATGHRSFANDIGVWVEPGRLNEAVLALLLLFVEKGDRSDRKRARLKHMLDSWGVERFVADTEARMGWEMQRVPLAECTEPAVPEPGHTHVGAHPQRQPGLFYFGATCAVGQLTPEQMRRVAEIADLYGNGEVRLTVWQSLLLTGIPERHVPTVERALRDLGFGVKPSNVTSGIIACTGSQYCKYAQADTKAHAVQLSEHLARRLELDQPVNIHFTGCPHSCAQHAMGDIGLLGTRVKRADASVDGYHVFVGGGFGKNQALGRQVFTSVACDEVPVLLEKMLRAYLTHREGREAFQSFTTRFEVGRLQELFS
jgi:ferredoxin-nitrite reductase